MKRNKYPKTKWCNEEFPYKVGEQDEEVLRKKFIEEGMRSGSCSRLTEKQPENTRIDPV